MQFLYQNVLFLMLIPTFLLMFLILTNKDNFQKHFSKEVLEKLSISNNYMSKTSRNVLFFIALILMTIALARPVANEKEQSFKQDAAAIVVAIDVSKSMLANDIQPNRLTLAQKKLLSIIENSKQNAIAVILFAKSSFILSPVTQDFNSLKILVENLDSGMNFDSGSNIFSTLETTNKLLKDYNNKNLILLTDGGNNTSYEKEIEYANENKINIYTIALATKKAAPIKLENGDFLTNKDGSIVTVSLNEQIKELSLNSNGGYITYVTSNNDVMQILADIEQKSTKQEFESKKFKTYTELFYYPLGLAIFILLIAFSSLPSFFKKNTTNIFFMLILFYSNDLKAFELDFKTIEKATQAYENKDFKKASKEFEKISKTSEARYNLANSLYKEERYMEALGKYKSVITTNKALEFKKLHNMGNTYVKLDDLDNAMKMYENALKIKDDKETKENLETILKHLNQKNRQNKHNQKNQKDRKQKNQNKQEKKDSQKNNDDKNKENKNQSEQKQKNQEKNSENKNLKQNSKNQDSNKEQNSKQKKQQQGQQGRQQIKPQEISDLEERKWLNQLQNKKTPVLLKKVKTKNEDTSSNPW